MADTLTFGSLFAGIGGMDLGLERAGMRCEWQVEIDEWCRRVLTKHWPDVPKYTDVRGVGAGSLAPVDLICGGFPCQDISQAGRRAGIDGERSGLWSEFARLVGELRPRYVLVENVAALLGRGMGRVLGDLAEIGYDAEWDCIPAAAVGAPHLRDRVFIVAHDSEYGRRSGRQGRFGAGSEEQRVAVWSFQAMADPNPSYRRTSGESEDQAWAAGLFIGPGESPRRHGWAVEPTVGRVAHGVPARVDRLRGLGNAVVPQVAEFIGRQLLASLECSSLLPQGTLPHGGVPTQPIHEEAL